MVEEYACQDDGDACVVPSDDEVVGACEAGKADEDDAVGEDETSCCLQELRVGGDQQNEVDDMKPQLS